MPIRQVARESNLAPSQSGARTYGLQYDHMSLLVRKIVLYCQPTGPTVGSCLGPYGRPSGGVSYERGTPVV